MKIFFKVSFIATIAVASTAMVAYKVYDSIIPKVAISDIMLANIEALASGEGQNQCKASVSCGDLPSDFVECTGSTCRRYQSQIDKKYNWVECDGIKTYCQAYI